MIMVTRIITMITKIIIMMILIKIKVMITTIMIMTIIINASTNRLFFFQPITWQSYPLTLALEEARDFGRRW